MRTRLAGAAAALALALGLLAAAAGPAPAAAPEGSFSSPGDNAVLGDNTPTVAGQFTQPSSSIGRGTVNEVTVTVESVAHPDVTFQRRFSGSNGNETLRFSWDVPALIWNGEYRATAVGRGTDAGVDPNGPELATISRNFRVRVPPAVPGGVTTSVDRGAVTVRWQANGEPDLIGYQVQRAPRGSSDWRNLGGATRGTTITDAAVPQPGEWSYRVIAARAGSNDSDIVMSGPSAPATANVAQPAPPTTQPPPPPPTSPPPGGGTGTNPGTGGGTGSAPGTGTGGGTGTAPSGGSPGGSGGPTNSGGASASGDGSSGTTGQSGNTARNFAALNNSGRSRTLSPPDTGFSRQLPFETPTSLDEMEEPAELGDQELGADEPPVRVGRPAMVDDEADRRTSLSFLAGGLLAFVMLMQVLWIKSEVDRSPSDLPAEPPPPSPPASPRPSPPSSPAARPGVTVGAGVGAPPARNGTRPSVGVRPVPVPDAGGEGAGASGRGRPRLPTRPRWG